MSLSRPLVRYHGGKWKLAPWIISHFPSHKIYVEPFGGGASVLLRKQRVYAEVYNDLDNDIVNLFTVLRDKDMAATLREKLYMTPFSRLEFTDAYTETKDPIEKARRLIVRSFMGFGSAGHNIGYKTGFRRKSFRSGTSPAWDWKNYPDAIPAIVERLRGVCIENKPASDVIDSLDREDVLFYVDPPYVHSTRATGGNCYPHEMSDEQHAELASQLLSLKGMVVLSGYDCKLYEDLFSTWKKVTREHRTEKATSKTECLWISPNTERQLSKTQLNLFKAEVA